MKQMLIGKKRNLISSLKLAFMSGLLLASSFDSSFAATGDTLYQNCTSSGGCTGAGSNTGWVRTVVSSGCYSGSCLKLVGSHNSNNGLYGAGSTSISNTSVKGKKEITISQWVKYNKDVNSIDGGNMKLDRAYSGEKFYATSISPSFGNDYYMGAMKGTMINKASWFEMVESTKNKDYPVNNGNGTYSVNGYIKGKITSGGPTACGTSWVKVTKWIKLPTTDTGTNGAVKIWIGDQLLYELINVGAFSSYPIGTTFKSLSFYPSSEAKEPFEHWVDEMIIYEGYVPPSGSGDNGSSTPPVTNTSPSTVVDFKLDN
jgi:hypothetical protein